jgi:hypothetical protein
VPSRVADTHDLLQHRVALYLKVMFIIMAVFIGAMTGAAYSREGRAQ